MSEHKSCGHDHDCGCGHAHHEHAHEPCPVCGHDHHDHHHHATPEETLNRIEEAVQKIPLKNRRDRKDRLILLSAGTAAEAAEHNDITMLQIIEVYLSLRLAEESGKRIPPEEGVALFRKIARMSGSALTAKFGLEGLTKLEIAEGEAPSPASLVFVTCYGIGKVLAHYFQPQGDLLSEEEAKEKFKAAKAEAYRLI